MKEIRKFAQEGNADAQFMLGNLYFNGEDVKKDYELAVEWFLKSAAQDFTEAQYALGVMYYEGRGVQPDTEMAVIWLTKAARKKHIRAQYLLADIYYDGVAGEGPNYEKAREWFAKAAENGDSDAMTRLGNMWENGEGVGPSKSAAVDWYYQAGMACLKYNHRDEALDNLDYIGRADSQNPLWRKLRDAIYSKAPHQEK